MPSTRTVFNLQPMAPTPYPTGWRSALHPLSAGSARYLFSHRALLRRTTLNELQSRYAGSHLGALWIVLAPLLILAVYALTYVEILRIRLAGLTSAEYVVFISRDSCRI